ncbi:tetratricopeptide repeat protein [Leifsonia shinshuensis]|uniref:Tetratricopeptide (TPR) repeat protein n=1 Tax=Leifsonia shinshuensis TaxID=150026 RepID=A0A853CQH9_9MICO|nr:tetratricopeptide repeat protein [Leifsonia shinshuensis]NYJ22183.1 tetratricopeptide (TPR) repeat protein [Leifsonia shinshuensis]
MPTTSPELLDRLAVLFAARDRDNMRPTIDAFLAVLAEHPDDPHVLYEVGGSYDTAGEEETAAGYYERALDAGLAGDTLRKCLLQHGSTLRNLERFDESLAVLDRARAAFPESESVRVWHALSLHAAGRSDGAVAELMELAADRIRTPDLLRYEAGLRGNAEYLRELDAAR